MYINKMYWLSLSALFNRIVLHIWQLHCHEDWIYYV